MLRYIIIAVLPFALASCMAKPANISADNVMDHANTSTVLPPECGSANGTVTSTFPTKNLCRRGTVVELPVIEARGGLAVTDTWWEWGCRAEDSSRCCGETGPVREAPCAALANGVVRGVCGAAALTELPGPPKKELCAVGTSSPVVQGNHGWVWECKGSPEQKATTAECMASRSYREGQQGQQCRNDNGATFPCSLLR